MNRRTEQLSSTTLTALAAGAPQHDTRLGNSREAIRSALDRSSNRVIVLDDDPTGTQSVHGIPVLTAWSLDDLRWAFSQPTAGFFVLTNTRGRAEAEAIEIVTSIAKSVAHVARERNESLTLIARGDSTLRGHYPVETDALAAVAREEAAPYDALLMAPAYFAAGRVTADDVHYADVDGSLVPVGQTSYANDSTFGFHNSNLREYIEEKTDGAVRSSDVTSVNLADIREGGADRVRDIILATVDGAPIVVNALDEVDFDVVVLGLIAAERQGHRVLGRTGPSFVAARLGLTDRGPLTHDEVFPQGPRSGRGLIVVGSHVELTSRQVEHLIERTTDLRVIELDVERFLDPRTSGPEVERCAGQLLSALSLSDTMLVTSRIVVTGDSGDSSLVIARKVSAALSALVARCVESVPLAWVLAKGGITSSDVATEGLGIRRAMVAGQLFPGIVSVWLHECGGHTALAGLPYIVFAGNVGDEATLAEAVAILRRRSGVDRSDSFSVQPFIHPIEQ